MANQMICPDGHVSTAADYCSECGVQMPVQQPPAVAAPTPGANETCPKCGAEREDPSSPFCGVCGYNFNTGEGGEVVQPVQAVQNPAPEPKGLQANPAPDAGVLVAPGLTGPHIDLEITFTDPAITDKLHFALFAEENLIGRQSSTVKQSVPLSGARDQAVSARHCMINRNPDGTWIINDVGSTNGTKVNGQDLTPGIEQQLNQGDRIEIGKNTVITVLEISL